MSENNILKIRLKTLRNNLGFTQEDVAKKVGLTKSAYGYYEQGKTVPDAYMVSKLAEIFNVTTDYILGRTDIKKSELENENEDEEKDIEKAIDELLQQDGLMLCGDELDDEALLLLRDSIRTTIKLMRANKK